MITINRLTKTYQRPVNEVDITIGYSALRISLPVLVAIEKGRFKKAGLNVQLERFDTAQPLMQAVAHGNVDAGGYIALPIVEQAIQDGADVQCVTALIEDDDHRLSYMLSSSDEEDYQSITDLKGKTIGILPTVAYRQWLIEMLQVSGMKTDDIEIVEVAPYDQGAALKSGQIDILFTNDPVASALLASGEATHVFEETVSRILQKERMVFGSFVMPQPFIQASPEVTQRLIQVLDRAIEFVHHHQENAKKLMSRYVDREYKTISSMRPDAKYCASKDMMASQGLNQPYRFNTSTLGNNTSDTGVSTIFSEFAMKVEHGERVGVLGMNGTGKSTLLRMIAGMDHDYVGSIDLETTNIAYVYQKPLATLLPWYTCRENIFMVRDYHGGDKKRGETLLTQLIQALGIDFSLYAYPQALSGGQQQIVVLLRALVQEPELLIMDEPFTALDIEKRAGVIAFLGTYIQQQGITLVMCSHKGQEVEKLLDRTIVLDGKPTRIVSDSRSHDRLISGPIH